MTPAISRASKIGDVVKQCPDAASVMLSHGLHCVGCHVASWESVEQGCRGHGMPEEMIDEMVEEINMLIEEQDDRAKKGA